VTVKPGDIIVAGEDGVVRVPKERAAEVLKRSQEIDDRETKMVPLIKQYRALSRLLKFSTESSNRRMGVLTSKRLGGSDVSRNLEKSWWDYLNEYRGG
jgi:hypothetical protein